MRKKEEKRTSSFGVITCISVTNAVVVTVVPVAVVPMNREKHSEIDQVR
jgi:hypothetical protein